MDVRNVFKKYGAYIVAVVVFFVLAYIYCFPVLQGKVVGGGDNDTAAGVAQESIRYTKETGDYTWWNGAVFSGMPNYQLGGGHWKSDELLVPLNRIVSGTRNVGWTVFLYFICFFVLLRAFKVNKWVCIPGALAIGLSSYFLVIIAAGHMAKCVTLALIAVVVAGFKYIFDKRYVLGAILVMVFVALGFSPHPQMFYYYYMMMGLFWLAELWIHIKEKRIKDLIVATLIFVAATGIGLGAKMSNVFANSEYITQTMRGGATDISSDTGGEDASNSTGLDIEYATQWSYGIDETMTYLIPGFLGGASSIDVGKDSDLYRTLVKNGVPAGSAADFCKGVPMYWGEQPFTSGNIYMGALICFLFLLGLLIVEGPYKWALLAATAFSTALAWGHNCMWLTEFFFKYFPMYSKFRAVSSILIVAEVAMPLLAFLAIKEIMDGKIEKKKLIKDIYVSGGITAGLCLLFALFGGLMFTFTSSYDASWASNLPDWLYSAIVDQRRHLFHSDCWRSFFFVVAGAFVIWLYAKGKLKNGWLVALLAVLVVVDMWPVDKRYFNDDYFVSPRNRSNAFAIQPYEEQLLQDKSHFRVLNLTTSPWNDSRTSYYLKSIGGYSAVKLRRYQDLIDQHLSKMHWPVIGMLNAKYIIAADENGQPEPSINPYALGNAWYVDKLYVVDNANAESEALNTIELSHEAVLDKSFAEYVTDLEPAVPEDAYVVLNNYTPKELDYTSSSSEPGTIVFSEIYYPFGWKATIDGEPVDHFRVNYMLRAVNVPAGEHNIHFIFDPDSVRKGTGIATVFIIIIYLCIAGGIGLAVFKKVKSKKAAE